MSINMAINKRIIIINIVILQVINSALLLFVLIMMSLNNKRNALGQSNLLN